MQPTRTALPPHPIRFGAFELDPRKGELRKHGVRIRLREQSLQILLMLLEQPGEVVLREQIRERLWPDGTTVEFDRGINGAVQKLRDALGETAQNPRFIETLARRGYRFLMPVVELPEVAPALEEQTQPASPAGPFQSARSGLVLAIGILLGGLAMELVRVPVHNEEETRFLLTPPADIPEPASPQMALSPDGRNLALVVETITAARRERSLWIRPLHSLDATPLVSDSGFSEPIQGFPFWSPDGKFVAYFAGQALWKVAFSGGPAQKLADAPGAEGGAWGRHGDIIFGTVSGPLYQIPVSGGHPVPITRLDLAVGEISHCWPQFLPDGQRLAYLSRNRDRTKSAIYVQNAVAGQRKILMQSATRMMFAGPDRVLFASGNTLVAQGFDADKAELRGEPMPVGEVLANADRGRAAFSVSQSGVLVYRGPPQRPHQIVSCDRQGQCVPIGDPTRLTALALSPDERFLAATTYDNAVGESVWILEIGSGRISKSAVPQASFSRALWLSGPGDYVVAQGPSFRLYEAAIGISSVKQISSGAPSGAWIDSLSPDKSYFLLHDASGVFRLAADGSGRCQKMADIGRAAGFQVSPDGTRVVYTIANPQPEVYSAEFPSFRNPKQVSQGGGCQPLWRRDGKELFYLLPRDGTLMAAPVQSTANAIIFGPAESLFRRGIPVAWSWNQYAVTGNGEHFYFYTLNADPKRASDLNVVLNWPAVLRR